MDGNLVSTGGFQGGANTVRYLTSCDTCDWKEYPTALADPRWYFYFLALHCQFQISLSSSFYSYYLTFFNLTYIYTFQCFTVFLVMFALAT